MMPMDPGTRVIVAAVTFGGLAATSAAIGHLFGLAAASAVWAGASVAFASVGISARLAHREQWSPMLSRGDLTFMMRALDDVHGGSMVSIVERDGITGVRAARGTPRMVDIHCAECGRTCLEVGAPLHAWVCVEGDWICKPCSDREEKAA